MIKENIYCSCCRQVKLFYCKYPKIIMYLNINNEIKLVCENCYLKHKFKRCKQIVNVYFKLYKNNNKNVLLWSKDINRFNLIFNFLKIDTDKKKIANQLFDILANNKVLIEEVSDEFYNINKDSFGVNGFLKFWNKKEFHKYIDIEIVTIIKDNS